MTSKCDLQQHFLLLRGESGFLHFNTVVQHSGHQITAMHEYISDVHKSAYFNTGVLHGAQQINTMYKYISYIHRGYLIKPELRCPNAQKELYLFSA